jgi:hypothetical protein
MTLKRSGDEEGYPAAKRARVDDCEDTEATSGSLGECTFKLVLNDKGDAKEDDILVLDSDKQLLWEVVELLNDLKL